MKTGVSLKTEFKSELHCCQTTFDKEKFIDAFSADGYRKLTDDRKREIGELNMAVNFEHRSLVIDRAAN